MLEKEKRFQAKYEKARSTFDKNEAEVYKEGENLVIRLKGLNFPIGQAVIMPENYHLLSMVQKAIREFDDAKIKIEGHTDSTGPQVFNQKLSSDRAEAVKLYLISNKTVETSKVNVAGFGDQKPIAPNNTANGRMKNRRIDVIVRPDMGTAG